MSQAAAAAAVTRHAPRDPRSAGDSGSAMILTLMVMALVTALATTVSVVTINNLQSSSRAQQAGAALNAADAGLAQAMSYLRSSGVRELRCATENTVNTCADGTWGSKSKPAKVTLPGKAGQSYSAWIVPVASFPTNDPGRYLIRSIGRAAGSAARTVEVTIGITSSDVPRGIFARSVSGGGNASVARESIFSAGCVFNRSKIAMEGEDVAYGIPVGVHSSQIITDSNGTGQFCPTTAKPIHRSGNKNQILQPCALDPDYRFDQDKLGGSLLGTTCESTETDPDSADYYKPQSFDGDAAYEVNGSYLEDEATLFSLFGLRTPALGQSQIDQLRTIAQSQGNYWNSASTWTSPDETNAVMFFDLSASNPGGLVDLNNITNFGREANLSDADPACQSKSLTIVIAGGNVKINSNQQLAASLFLTSPAPYGQVVKANGTASFIGTIYADTVNLTGTVNLSSDTCFLANATPALLDLEPTGYRELDR